MYLDRLTLQLFCADNLISFWGHHYIVPLDWRIINVRFNVGIEEQFPGVDVYDVPLFRQKEESSWNCFARIISMWVQTKFIVYGYS